MHQEKFGDPGAGGFFFTAADATELAVRQKTAADSPLPSGNAVAGSQAITIVNREQGSGSRASVDMFFTGDGCQSGSTPIKEVNPTSDFFSTGNVLTVGFDHATARPERSWMGNVMRSRNRSRTPPVASRIARPASSRRSGEMRFAVDRRRKFCEGGA